MNGLNIRACSYKCLLYLLLYLSLAAEYPSLAVVEYLSLVVEYLSLETKAHAICEARHTHVDLRAYMYIHIHRILALYLYVFISYITIYTVV